MKPLIDRIREAAEFKPNPNLSERAEWGRDLQHAQSAWQREALEIAVEALRYRTQHDEDCMDSTEKFEVHEMCECGASVVKQALTEIAALVPSTPKGDHE
jgi:redox-regulated HSP33 family molecular chaperone